MIPTQAETLYYMVSLIAIFFIFGMSIHLLTLEKVSNDYLLRKKLKRILRKIEDIEDNEGNI